MWLRSRAWAHVIAVRVGGIMQLKPRRQVQLVQPRVHRRRRRPEGGACGGGGGGGTIRPCDVRLGAARTSRGSLCYVLYFTRDVHMQKALLCVACASARWCAVGPHFHDMIYLYYIFLLFMKRIAQVLGPLPDRTIFDKVGRGCARQLM